jgi:predicted metal-dependent phosphoesterase TrpH
MTARQPFTTLCQTLARSRQAARADLHIHTTQSDGTYTAAQVMDVARRSGLAAVSITDHDSLAALPAARRAASAEVELVPGVELTSWYRGCTLHLLGYFFRPEDRALQAALEQLRRLRTGRFFEMVARLRSAGVCLGEEELPEPSCGDTLGRRHLAELLVKTRRVPTIRDAFQRYLSDGGPAAVPPVGLPVAEAIGLVRAAGGVAAWAHPSYDCSRATMSELRDLGLDAVEAEYPGFRRSRVGELRALAASLGLAISGGSDCHGPDNYHRAIGACGISTRELDLLRDMAGGRG